MFFVFSKHFNFFNAERPSMKSLAQIHKDLDDRILNESFSDLKEIMDWFSGIEIADIDSRSGFVDENYCRIPLIAKDEYDLLLCCWKPGQMAPIHGHPNQGCLVKIISGTLTEEIIYNNGKKEIRVNRESDVGYIHDSIGQHSVSNESTENAVSLHLYAPGGYNPTFD